MSCRGPLPCTLPRELGKWLLLDKKEQSKLNKEGDRWWKMRCPYFNSSVSCPAKLHIVYSAKVGKCYIAFAFGRDHNDHSGTFKMGPPPALKMQAIDSPGTLRTRPSEMIHRALIHWLPGTTHKKKQLTSFLHCQRLKNDTVTCHLG
jgi:hypothetical protein